MENNKSFLTYMDMAAILVKGVWPFEYILNHTSTEGSTCNLLKADLAVLEEKLFEDLTISYM